MTRAEQTAINFTILGIEGLIRHNESRLAEIDHLDATLGEVGREARAASRPIIEEKLKLAQEALRIRKANGGR